MNISPATVPTFYFIGVTTAQSSIMKIFPRWMEILGMEVQIAGVDVPIRAPGEVYRVVIEQLRDDRLVRGALVTTHKIDVFQAAHDLFDHLDAYAQLCGEVSAISKREGGLYGSAKDPISSGLTWQAFVPAGHFAHSQAEVLCFGSGGAAVATSVFLANLASAADRPGRFTLVDINPARLEHARAIHTRLKTDIVFEYYLNDEVEKNDHLMAALAPGSIVINATGMGKDLPGSPVSDQAVFPQRGVVWEFNYRGELSFLKQARRQAQARSLVTEDGWRYFLHGWTQAIAEVFQFDLTPDLFARFDQAARG